MRRQLLEDASQHFLLLHTGQLEALTCPVAVMHRWGLCRRFAPSGVLPSLEDVVRRAFQRQLHTCDPCQLALPCSDTHTHHPGGGPSPSNHLLCLMLRAHVCVCSLRDDVVPLEAVQRLADELQRSSRAFHLELLPVRSGGAWRGREGCTPAQECCELAW